MLSPVWKWLYCSVQPFNIKNIYINILYLLYLYIHLYLHILIIFNLYSFCIYLFIYYYLSLSYIPVTSLIFFTLFLLNLLHIHLLVSVLNDRVMHLCDWMMFLAFLLADFFKLSLSQTFPYNLARAFKVVASVLLRLPKEKRQIFSNDLVHFLIFYIVIKKCVCPYCIT